MLWMRLDLGHRTFEMMVDKTVILVLIQIMLVAGRYLSQ